jgi:SSS family solute:Na+ symporter
VVEKQGIYSTTTATRLLVTIGATTICWVLAAYLAPQTERKTLIEFYKKVHPAGPGWDSIRQEAGISEDRVPQLDNIPLALLGWVTGCTMIWSALFTVGNFLYGRLGYGIGLLVICATSAAVLIAIVNKLWSTKDDIEPELEPERDLSAAEE